MSYRFPFPPYPSGWFRVATSSELRPGKIKSLHYFGRDLVLWRAHDGEVSLLANHCPHLGTDLGQGVVTGNTIRCPFHGWRFGADGTCVHIPGQAAIPHRARVDRWPTVEANGQIMGFYHPNGQQPTWRFPDFPETSSPEWTSYRCGPRWPRVRTHVQELQENGFDINHVNVLHSRAINNAETVGILSEQHVLTHRMVQNFKTFGPIRAAGPVEVQLIGLGAAVTRATTLIRSETALRMAFEIVQSLVFFPTPIDDEHIEVSSIIALKKLRSRAATEALLRKAAREGRKIIEQDIPIWERKEYRRRPVLSRRDRPIMVFRKWAQQFYSLNNQIETEREAGPGENAGTPVEDAANSEAARKG